MQNFKQIVSSAGKLLLAHPVGQQAHIGALWNRVDFNVVEQSNTENDARLCAGKDAIALYPVLLERAPAQADTILLREFGLMLLRRAGASNRTRWSKKLVLPSERQITAVQGRLGDQALRGAGGTYLALVESFKTATDRLVALNITNALLANGMPFESSVGVKITEWGPTAEYSTGKKYHSIIPLTSAYAPAEVHRCYGCAFAEMIVNKMRAVKESSTARSLETLVRDIAAEVP